ncbi:hypothetical protein R1flu_006973 [Riccia fluitans]|uniref:Uncharacterized protein n=1 Tax=Riccia fluitans TaxID=41844 RepID=A0ABD1YXK5_9MARC
MASLPVILDSERLLGASNNSSWKWRSQAILEGEGLWDLVEGSAPEVTTSLTSATSEVTDAAATKEVMTTTPVVADSEVQRKRRLRALVILKRSVTYDVMPYVVEVKTPREFWDSLRRRFDVKSSARLLMLRQKFSLLKCKAVNRFRVFSETLVIC